MTRKYQYVTTQEPFTYNTMQALFRHPDHDVSLYILYRIARALKVSMCDLIEEDATD